jgi:hypothetical protein
MKFKLMGICTMAFYLTQASAYSDPQKEYMLCDSMLKHDLVAASELLDQGADPNTTCSEAGRNLFSPLYLSMVDSSGAGEKLSLKMISKNASASSINTFRGSWGRRTVISNFDEACRFSYPALKAFLDKGVDPLTVDQPGVSPLFALLNGGCLFQQRLFSL